MLDRFRIDRSSALPVYVQLAEQIRLLIHRGELAQGDAMPTVRELAVELGINANTVARVYRELQQQGLLRLERGVGTFVDAPTEASTVSAAEFRRIETAARLLVERGRGAGLSSRELVELIHRTWKETES